MAYREPYRTGRWSPLVDPDLSTPAWAAIAGGVLMACILAVMLYCWMYGA
jgi:hypothetical protein